MLSLTQLHRKRQDIIACGKHNQDHSKLISVGCFINRETLNNETHFGGALHFISRTKLVHIFSLWYPRQRDKQPNQNEGENQEGNCHQLRTGNCH